MSPTVRESEDRFLERCWRILEAFDAQQRSLSMSQIVERTGVPTSTCYRLVASLERLGIVERHRGAVTLSMRLFELGRLAGRNASLRDVALPFIADLRAATGQTIHLAILDGPDVVYLEIVHANNGPPLPSRVGGRLPAYATGVGKAMLANFDAEELSQRLPEHFERIGPNTVTNRAALESQLARIRTTDIAFEEQESSAAVVCAASAIMSASGEVVGAVSASGWVRRMDLRRVAPAVRTCALGIGRELGRSPAGGSA